MSVRMVVVLGALAAAGAVPVLAQSYAFNPGCHPGAFAAPVNYANNYANNYAYPVQKVVAHEVAVAPLLVTVPVHAQAVPVHAYAPNYYYSVGDAYRQKSLIRDVLREELRSFAGKGQPEPQQQQQQAPPQQPAPPASINQSAAAAAVDDATPPELQQQVLAALKGKANCVSCHTAGVKTAGDFALVTEDDRLLKLPSDKKWKVYGMSSVGAMPPAAANDASKAMESQHLPALLRWAALK